MNDTTRIFDENDADETADETVDELTLLKAQADLMGVPYKSNTRLETLRERLRQAREGDAEKAGDDDEDLDDAETPVTAAKPAKRAETHEQKMQRIREEQKRDALALVRCRIANMNPAKADLRGEIITVINAFIGTVSKLIPFGEETDNGYHIPKVLYDDLVSRQFQQVSMKRDPRTGREVVTRRLVPEYNIQVLPALTVEEIAELAVKQAAAERLGA